MAEMGKLDHLEERLRAIEGGEDYAFANLKELFLEPNIITPPKFKVPDFDKYKGTTCPKNHLKMYCQKMGEYAKDEELLIHSFHNRRDFTCCGMQGVWSWVIMRALQSVL